MTPVQLFYAAVESHCSVCATCKVHQWCRERRELIEDLSQRLFPGAVA